MDSGLAAIGTTLVGIAGGVSTWLMGAVIFGAFVAGIVFAVIGIYLVSEAY